MDFVKTFTKGSIIVSSGVPWIFPFSTILSKKKQLVQSNYDAQLFASAYSGLLSILVQMGPSFTK